MMTTLGKRRIVEVATEGRSHHIFSPYPCLDISCPGYLCKRRAQAKKGPVYFPFSVFHLILALNWLAALKKLMRWMLHRELSTNCLLLKSIAKRCPLNENFFFFLFVFLSVSLCLFIFLSRHHSDQMSEGSKVSKVTLCVEILKWRWVTESLTKVRYRAARAAKKTKQIKTCDIW